MGLGEDMQGYLLIIRGSRIVYYIALLISMGSWKFSSEREFME